MTNFRILPEVCKCSLRDLHLRFLFKLSYFFNDVRINVLGLLLTPT